MTERTPATTGADGDAHAAFEDIVGGLRYPMFVVTATADDERSGCLVGFATQSSVDPARFTVWISDANHTAAVAARAEVLGVHVLRADEDGLAAHFGEQTGDVVDKLADVPWSPGPEGVPVLARCDWFAGRVVERLVGHGDHRGYVLEPIAGAQRHAGLEPLLFDRVRHLRPGHAA